MAECRSLPLGQRIIYCSDLSGMEIVDNSGRVVAAIPHDVILGIMAEYLRRQAISALEQSEDEEILSWWSRR